MPTDSFTSEQKQVILSFVRTVISNKLTHQPLPPIPENIRELHVLGSCFVTLHTTAGELRGCIGNITPIENLGDNLRHNAINAAFRDPRFPAVSETDELEQLIIEVSILTPMEEIASTDDFIIGRHGIVLSLYGRSAVFLPQVAPEQGWDRNTTLDYLSLKAGLPKDAWRSQEARFMVFEAIVFSEETI